jgi:hypothetical protein
MSHAANRTNRFAAAVMAARAYVFASLCMSMSIRPAVRFGGCVNFVIEDSDLYTTWAVFETGGKLPSGTIQYDDDCTALRCAYTLHLRCAALRCAALRCAALRCAAPPVLSVVERSML